MGKPRATSAAHPDESEGVLFAARVRAGRAVLGWSQTALGKKTAITQRAIHRIEAGAVQSRKATMVRIDKAFDKAGLKFRVQADARCTLANWRGFRNRRSPR
jgi:ribosome-binding protein aMBF1 (putative translation factor)